MTALTPSSMAAVNTLSVPTTLDFDRFQGKELAGWNLFQCRGMKNIVNSMDGILDRSKVAHITNEELDLSCNIRHAA